MESTIGFDRRVKLAWLDATAWKVGMGEDVADIRRYLNKLLGTEGEAKEACRKTITVLTRIWARVPDEHRALWRRGLELVLESDAETRLWLHWGMTLLAYPFFRDIAAIIGRLLTLQDEVSLKQISRRVEERWGERSTVRTACRRVVRSMVDWGVLRDAGPKGVYIPAAKKQTGAEGVQLWFLEALLRSEATAAIPLSQLLNMPSAFPFHLDVSVVAMRQQFEIQRQGLDLDMVAVKR